jgi:hypothetical protein
VCVCVCVCVFVCVCACVKHGNRKEEPALHEKKSEGKRGEKERYQEEEEAHRG